MNILLFPGSFSPYTDGHYGLVSRYISAANNQNMKLDKIVIFLSSKDREGISSKSVFKFISQIYSNDKRFEIKISDGSPISDVYSFVNNNSNKGDNFIFLRSNKDDDKAADDFYKGFSKGGKYELEGVNVVKLDDVSDLPLVYKNRDDEFNGKPISASVARNDLRNNNFDLFKTNYRNIIKSEISIDENHLRKYFDKWVQDIEPITKDSEKKLNR